MLYQVITDGKISESYAMPDHDDSHHITTAKRNIAGGIAGLDSTGYINISLLPVGLYEYSNHLGVIDDYLIYGNHTNASPNGSVTGDSTNHEIDINSGTAGISRYYLRSKEVFTLSTGPLIGTFIPQNISVAASSGTIEIGFFNPASIDMAQVGAFFQYTGSTYRTVTNDGGATGFTVIPDLNNGDLLNIIATSSSIIFMVNNIIVATHLTYIPTSIIFLASAARISSGSTASTVSMDYIGYKKYL